ncbi:DUF3313 domain-containing protein [Thiorhodococcus fuscus]|uniref:DUF3313 domain-containing protein n=1 Tax=Thiorhodococcus fuscus TaxID=527200 RepID=A0ABW4YAN4_9GAMM
MDTCQCLTRSRLDRAQATSALSGAPGLGAFDRICCPGYGYAEPCSGWKLEPLRLYPEPRPTEQVSREELKRILAYANQALKRKLTKRFILVKRPQPGAVRLRAAISGVAAQGEGLAPYQYVPIALAATMAKRAVAGTLQRAFIVGESELLDGVSGELLAQQVKVGSGAGAKLEKIAGKDRITLETLKPLLDELAAAALPNLEQVVRPRAGQPPASRPSLKT